MHSCKLMGLIMKSMLSICRHSSMSINMHANACTQTFLSDKILHLKDSLKHCHMEQFNVKMKTRETDSITHVKLRLTARENRTINCIKRTLCAVSYLCVCYAAVWCGVLKKRRSHFPEVERGRHLWRLGSSHWYWWQEQWQREKVEIYYTYAKNWKG